MSEVTFGERLADARHIKGESIEEVSEQLRIRPSIILAMETSNFLHMPHKGYARNMVSSYARYLGLDSTRLTEQFLREFRRWESRGNQIGSSNASSFALTTRRTEGREDPLLESDRLVGGREMITAARRNEERESVWGKGNKQEVDRKFRTQLRQAQEDKSLRQTGPIRRTPTRRAEGDATPNRQVRTNDYVGKPPRKTIFSGVSTGLSSRPLLLVIGLVVVFIVILVLWAVLASTCAKENESTVPVTGVSSSDSGLTEDEASNSVEDIEAQIQEDNRYGPFELVVEVEGGDCWLQIDVDGTTVVGQTCESGWSGSYTVASECSVVAGAPGYVKVFRNGVDVALEEGAVELAVEQRPIVANAQNADAASQE